MTTGRERLAEAIGAVEAWLMTAVKTVGEVTRNYDDVLTRFAFELLNATISKVDFRRMHKALIRSLATKAYTEGMREAGIADPLEAMDEDDRAAIQDWIDEQVSRVNDFSDWLDENKTSESTRRELATRIDYWVQALDTLGNLGRASANANMMVEWKTGPTEHCPTCLEFEGQRHRLKWWVGKGYIPREPGSQTLDCRGYRCACSLVNDLGERIL